MLTMPHRFFWMLAALFAFCGWAEAGALSPDWAARVNNGNAVVLMRHALAPGVGDPLGFSVEDCSTQRNLSALGRAQARQIGENLRKVGINQAQVLSSPWCRCVETAEALELGPVETLAALGSFFAGRGEAARQTQALRARLAEHTVGAMIVVTHQVNLTALTGVVPVSGELLIVSAVDPTQVLLRVKP